MNSEELKEALEEYNPVSIMNLEGSEPKYAPFLSYYWSVYGDEMKAAFLAEVDIDTLTRWQESETYIKHKGILDAHRIKALESDVIGRGANGDSKSSEFILSHNNAKYSKKKSDPNAGASKSVAEMVGEMASNG